MSISSSGCGDFFGRMIVPWDSGCSLPICCDGPRYLCAPQSLPVCVSIHKPDISDRKALFIHLFQFFCTLDSVASASPAEISTYNRACMCQLIGLIAALNRINVSPRQRGGFTDNLQLHDAHGEKRLGPLGPAPVLCAQHVKCLRQNSRLIMKLRVGGRGERKQRQKLQRGSTWEREPYFWSCILGATKHMVTED